MLAPEHAADLTHLASILTSAGLSVDASAEDGTVVVKAPGATAADLNRLAAAEGITLRQISERTHSLEDLFFRLTGTGAAMSRGQEMGAIR